MLLQIQPQQPKMIRDTQTALLKAIQTAAAAKHENNTTAKNRVCVKVALLGTNGSSLEYGPSIRADNAAAGTGGSQYISGSFGKISIGHLNGADEQLVGNISDLSFPGLGDKNKFIFQPLPRILLIQFPWLVAQ